MTPALFDQITTDHRAGLSVYAIADKHGIHRQTVTNHLVDAGVVLRRTTTAAERSRVQELFEGGVFIKDIAAELGRNPATVAKIIRQIRPGEASPPA